MRGVAAAQTWAVLQEGPRLKPAARMLGSSEALSDDAREERRRLGLGRWARFWERLEGVARGSSRYMGQVFFFTTTYGPS